MARYQAGLRTEQRILDATREVLSESGLEGSTLKAICARAGIQAGSFYNLFASKEEAVLRVVAESISAADHGPTASDGETVADLVNAYVDFVSGEPELARIYAQLAATGGLSDATIAQRYLHHHERRKERMSRAIRRTMPELPEGAARSRAELLLAALNGLAFHSMLQPAFDLSAHAAELAELPFAQPA